MSSGIAWRFSLALPPLPLSDLHASVESAVVRGIAAVPYSAVVVVAIPKSPMLFLAVFDIAPGSDGLRRQVVVQHSHAPGLVAVLLAEATGVMLLGAPDDHAVTLAHVPSPSQFLFSLAVLLNRSSRVWSLNTRCTVPFLK